METKKQKFSQSTTAKAIIIGVLTLLLLIPNVMVTNLIEERQSRSVETTEKINSNWSLNQTVIGPILCIPYTYSYTENKRTITEYHNLYVAPNSLKINGEIFPKEKHFGIYKSILYQSSLNFAGTFDRINWEGIPVSSIKWDEAKIYFGISDLRGIKNNLDFKFLNNNYTAEAVNNKELGIDQGLVININLDSISPNTQKMGFSCNLSLNGSSYLRFIPIGKETKVNLKGNWQAPGFEGNFSPEYKIDKNGFNAEWKVLHFNRNIPQIWRDNEENQFTDTEFGVNLVDTVNHYQQNMRSSKYAIMFIALTFVVFFFVEIFSKRKIHPIQYLLVGFALILFYSLLLSISEQLNFGLAYLLSSILTIGLIVIYAHSIFKNKLQSISLFSILSILYSFLYVILQLEDIALLIGSLGLFIVLGLIMYFSKKINWYRTEDNNPTE